MNDNAALYVLDVWISKCLLSSLLSTEKVMICQCGAHKYSDLFCCPHGAKTNKYIFSYCRSKKYLVKSLKTLKCVNQLLGDTV